MSGEQAAGAQHTERRSALSTQRGATSSAPTALRTGVGYDLHPYAAERTLVCTLTGRPLAGTALFITPIAEARVTAIQYSTPTVAFGGYSWPGVGQYVKITGVAYAEVDPGDPRNAIIAGGFSENYFDKVRPYEEILPKELRDDILKFHMIPGYKPTLNKHMPRNKL